MNASFDAQQKTQTSAEVNPHRWLALVILLTAGFMDLLDLTGK